MAYDAAKAKAFNQLRQAGVSEDAALQQAGITDADVGNYALGNNGQMGPLIAGGGKVAGVDYEKLTPAELQEQARFDQGLKSVDYAEKSNTTPGSTKPITYTTTSTETVSGGGSTTIISGPRQATAASQAYGDAYAAKNAEYNQYIKDNPSDFTRKKQGLPPLTPEESQARQQQLDKLSAEKAELKNQQVNAETPGTPTIVTTPNTTTTTQTVTTGTAATNQEVDYSNDPQLGQQTEQQLAQTTSVARSSNSVAEPTPVTDGTTAEAPADSTIQTTNEAANVDTAEDPFEAARLERERDLGAQAPTLNPEDVPELDAGVQAQLEFEAEQNRSLLKAENYQPEPVDLDNDPAVKALDEESRAEAEARYNETSDPDGEYEAETKAKLAEVQKQATIQQRFKQTTDTDWRVRLRLAPDATYLYQDPSNTLLAPLRVSDGVVFPYTPTINTSYSAKYDPYDLTHSNYRGYFYRGSNVSDIQIQGTFTAQNTREAEYVLAVIHFFRSATKMFYGKDEFRGAPPPLVYLRGYGEYQFNDHACVISNFQYNLPNDVDYIAISPNNLGLNMSNRQAQVGSSPVSTISSAIERLNKLFNTISGQPGIPKGATTGRADLGVTRQTVQGVGKSTFVPTKIDITITLLPVQTRAQVSKEFSLKDFANGNGLRKGFW